MDVLSVVSILFVVAACAFLFSVLRRRERQAIGRILRARELEMHSPPTLHPIVDPSRCMGSGACIAACPEGEILGLVDGQATLIEGSKCIGHTRCQEVCPVDAIELVFGTADRPIDLPTTDGQFESSRPGVYVIGELGGMGLIKNAITQGLQVSDALHKKLSTGSSNGAVDVAIVGAGPAGVAAAVALAKQGHSFELLEQERLGGAIFNYPRQKIVMTETVKLPGFGSFGRELMSKEDLLEDLNRVTSQANVSVREGVRVTGLEGEDGAFSVQTSQGAVSARKVVLALGRQGTPRRLGVPGEDLEKVAYRLIEPQQYAQRRVLVVGGGDSAIEAACTLADDADAQVSISYRKPAFARCRPANRARIEDLIGKKAIVPLMKTTVSEIGEGHVTLDSDDGPVQIDNDHVFVCAGGILPIKFLNEIGVETEKHQGESQRYGSGRQQRKRRATDLSIGEVRGLRLGRLYLALGLTIVAVLALFGWDYYWLEPEARLHHPRHEFLRPAGLWGHGVGVVATAVMLLNFLYPARKRWRLLHKLGSLRSWMSFHVFVGIMSPTVIAFHAAFQSNNWLASATAISLATLVGTGLIGRWLFGLLPRAGERLMSPEQLAMHEKALYAQARESQRAALDREAIDLLLAELEKVSKKRRGLVSALVHLQIDFFRARGKVLKMRRYFRNREDYVEFREAYLRLWRTHLQVSFYDSLRRLMTSWRVLHVVLSIFMVLVMAAHIALSFFLGYRWIF